MVNINTVTTNKVNRILYFTAALVFIFYPQHEKIGWKNVAPVHMKFTKPGL